MIIFPEVCARGEQLVREVSKIPGLQILSQQGKKLSQFIKCRMERTLKACSWSQLCPVCWLWVGIESWRSMKIIVVIPYNYPLSAISSTWICSVQKTSYCWRNVSNCWMRHQLQVSRLSRSPVQVRKPMRYLATKNVQTIFCLASQVVSKRIFQRLA